MPCLEEKVRIVRWHSLAGSDGCSSCMAGSGSLAKADATEVNTAEVLVGQEEVHRLCLAIAVRCELLARGRVKRERELNIRKPRYVVHDDRDETVESCLQPCQLRCGGCGNCLPHNQPGMHDRAMCLRASKEDGIVNGNCEKAKRIDGEGRCW